MSLPEDALPEPQPLPVAVLSLGLPPDGRGLALFLAGRRPWAAPLDRAALAELEAAASALLAAPPGVLVPGQDAELARHEASVALRLASLLEAAPVGPALAALARGAADRGERLTLLLDLRDDTLRALPWELLELLAPADSLVAPCRVARLAEAPGPALPRTPALGLEVLVARLDPEDPICAQVAEATLAGLSRRASVRGRSVASGEPLPPVAATGTDAGHLRVLHLVSHGQVTVERVLVALGGQRSLDPATTARWVDPVRAGLDLAVLDICGAGAQGGGPGSAPAERLVQEGLPAAVAPSQPVDPAASACFSEALYAALSAGQPVYRAVDAGRRALGRLGVPHASCRWWTPILVVRDALALDRSCHAEPDGPRAWAPQADAAVLELLRGARDLAEVHGFLGVEHLALLLARRDPLPPRLALVRGALESIGQRLSAWHAVGEGALALSPRLAALLAALPAGAGLSELGDALVAIPWLAAGQAPGGGHHGSAETLQPGLQVDRRAHPIRSCTLEVLGGPEDGRRLLWDRSRPVLGRRDPMRSTDEAVELYASGNAVDLAVSRRHLRLQEDGRVRVQAETHLERAGLSLRLEGEALLAPGEVLVLGAATRLLVVSVVEGA